MSCSIDASATLCKAAGETRQYSMNFSELMATAETISGTPTVEDSTGDLTIATIAVSGQTVTVWVSGGTRGKTYTIVFTAVTSGGQTLIGNGKLRIL